MSTTTVQAPVRRITTAKAMAEGIALAVVIRRTGAWTLSLIHI